MAFHVEVLEPGEAIPRNRGYVGVVDQNGGDLYFPHVDSCMAVAFILDGGIMIGGHMALQWPGKGHNPDVHGDTVFRLMEVNRQRLGNKPVKKLVYATSGPEWRDLKGAIRRRLGEETHDVLDISFNQWSSGANVTVWAHRVCLEDCRNGNTKTFDMPADGEDDYKMV